MENEAKMGSDNWNSGCPALCDFLRRVFIDDNFYGRKYLRDNGFSDPAGGCFGGIRFSEL
ncbi:MAG: hypothetical protein K0S80_3217 [Neobacillus sp.]|nr:hypothetical protein [Neobacillus sp.]